MLFQHYTVDDFRSHEKILNKKINITDLTTLVKSADDAFCIITDTNESDVTRHFIEIDKPYTLLIHGKSLNKADRARKYNSFKNWLADDGFPVVANIKELRDTYPELDMMHDLQLALFVYAALYPLEPVNQAFNFEAGHDHITHFVDGFKEWGILEEFDRPLVSITKLTYLTKQGRKEQPQ